MTCNAVLINTDRIKHQIYEAYRLRPLGYIDAHDNVDAMRYALDILKVEKLCCRKTHICSVNEYDRMDDYLHYAQQTSFDDDAMNHITFNSNNKSDKAYPIRLGTNFKNMYKYANLPKKNHKQQ